MIYTLKIWKHYLLGQRIDVYNNHKNLKYIFSQKELTRRQSIWLELITDFDLYIRYHPGKCNIVPDVLSKKLMTMYLTRQKEIQEQIKRLELEVLLLGMAVQLMELQFQSTLINRIKEAKDNNEIEKTQDRSRQETRYLSVCR